MDGLNTSFSIRRTQRANDVTRFEHSFLFKLKERIHQTALLGAVLFYLCIPQYATASGAYKYFFPQKGNLFHPEATTVIGLAENHTIQPKDTLLDIARDHNLGFNEIADLYPQMDPWIPPVGMELTIPTLWVLPDEEIDGIVINIAELRLYHFMKKIQMVKTYPIGIGRKGWQTPLGTFRVTSKRIHPTWYVPPSLQKKYGMKTMPPGPDNPLGDYYMGLNNSDYGIHGTNFPWAVGRLVTHGCIRLYPEDIELLFQSVPVGTPVKIIYTPIKLGVVSGKIYVEVHHDIYHKIKDRNEYVQQVLEEKGLIGKVDMVKFRSALSRSDGLPVDISLSEQEAQIID